MKPAELRALIETGQLAPELAPFWADVFDDPAPVRAECKDDDEFARAVARYERIKGRAGVLKPDAAFEIHKRLTAAGVAVGSYQEVAEAKGS